MAGGLCFAQKKLTDSPRISGLFANPALLDEVVLELREIDRRTGIEKTLAIGELILVRFFGNDPEIWRNRKRNKNNSIRRLAEREDCPFRKSA